MVAQRGGRAGNRHALGLVPIVIFSGNARGKIAPRREEEYRASVARHLVGSTVEEFADSCFAVRLLGRERFLDALSQYNTAFQSADERKWDPVPPAPNPISVHHQAMSFSPCCFIKAASLSVFRRPVQCLACIITSLLSLAADVSAYKVPLYHQMLLSVFSQGEAALSQSLSQAWGIFLLLTLRAVWSDERIPGPSATGTRQTK